MKKIAILQSNYIPWKGYFDLIAAVDEFILYDTVQFTNRDWRNRNKIKTHLGIKWITIPVKHIARSQRIKDTQVSDSLWAKKHWLSLKASYARAKHFKQYQDIFEHLYQIVAEEIYLSQINYIFLTEICSIFKIKTKISWSHDYQTIDGRNERLIDLCQKAGANEYISGPSAKNYIDSNVFSEAGIKLTYINYEGYPEYPQLWGDFVHEVTILDLLFNCGKEASKYMKHFDK